MLLIPTPELDPVQDVYEFECALAGRSYVLRVEWSGTLWYLSVYAESTPLIEGQPLTMLRPVLLYCTSPLRPPGEIMLYTAGTDLSEAEREDLGGRCLLCYLDA